MAPPAPAATRDHSAAAAVASVLIPFAWVSGATFLVFALTHPFFQTGAAVGWLTAIDLGCALAALSIALGLRRGWLAQRHAQPLAAGLLSAAGLNILASTVVFARFGLPQPPVVVYVSALAIVAGSILLSWSWLAATLAVLVAVLILGTRPDAPTFTDADAALATLAVLAGAIMVHLVRLRFHRGLEGAIREIVTRDEELRRNRALLDEAERAGRVGSFEVDFSRRRASWSPGVARIAGLPDSREGAPFEAASAPVAPDDLPRVLRELDAARETLTPFSTTFRLSGEEERWIAVEAAWIDDAAGGEARLVGTAQDVTARVAAERERDAARRAVVEKERLAALGTLVAGVAHEINNPLTYVSGQVELTKLDLQEATSWVDGERRARLDEAIAAQDTILRGIERIAFIAKSLRRVARSPGGQRRLENVDTIVEGALAVAAPRLPPGVVVVSDYHAGGARVLADVAELSQVVLNVVLNAGEAMAAQGTGTLTVRTEVLADGGLVQVDVSDTGPGVPPEDEARLFVPFFTTKPDGTGLGLSISRRIATEHGGDLTLMRRDGPGATFRLQLPVARADSPEPTCPTPAG